MGSEQSYCVPAATTSLPKKLTAFEANLQHIIQGLGLNWNDMGFVVGSSYEELDRQITRSGLPAYRTLAAAYDNMPRWAGSLSIVSFSAIAVTGLEVTIDASTGVGFISSGEPYGWPGGINLNHIRAVEHVLGA